MKKETYKRSFLPLSLLALNDKVQYSSFNEVREGKYFNEIQKYLNNCFLEFENQHLMIQIREVLPFHAFLIENNNFKLSNLISNKSIYNEAKLTEILNFRIKTESIDKQLKIIADKGGNIKYAEFYSELFIYAYKYFYIETMDSIYTKKEAYKEGGVFNKHEGIVEYIRKFDTAKSTLEKIDFSNDNYVKYQNIIEKFNNSFHIFNDKKEDILSEIKEIKSNPKFANLLYSIIRKNIELPYGIDVKEKNNLLIPLFKEIVCRFCYPNVFNKTFTHRMMRKKYATFTRITPNKKNT